MAMCVAGGLLSVFAARHRNERGRALPLLPLWSRKRDAFTDAGWRYRTWSVRCAYLSVALLVADQLI
jgi:hypothetical protein